MRLTTKTFDDGVKAVLTAFPLLRRELDLSGKGWEKRVHSMEYFLGRLAKSALKARPLGELPRLDVQEATVTYVTKGGIQISISEVADGWEIHVFWPEGKPFDEEGGQLYSRLSEIGFEVEAEDPYEFDPV